MKTAASRILVSSIAVAALSSTGWAVDRIKQNNTTALNLAGSWDTLPTSSDVAVFNSTYATTGTLNTGALVTWQGIRIVDPGGNVIINNSTSGQEVALGSAGIDMSAATVNLNIQRLRVDASQTWNIASGRTFNLGSSSSVRAGVLSLGTGGPFTITKAGAGTVQLDTSNTAIGNVNWDIQAGLIRAIWNGSSAWGTGTITLGGGGIATGTNFSGSQGNWTWNNNISLTSSTSSFIDNQNLSGSDRWLKLTGVISGSGNVEFRDTGTGFNNSNFGHILAGTNTNTGTVTIASGAEVRVGGTTSNDANTGNNGKLAADSALVVNNGTLSFSRLDSHSVANDISGSGSLRIGLSATIGTATTSQVVTLSGSNTYTGTTTVNNGRLNLTGSLTSNITVQAAGRISGTGSTTGTFSTVAGAGIVLAGGDSYTSLVANGVTIGGATTVSFLTNPTAATTYDIFTYGAGGLTGAANLSAAWRGSFVDDTINQKYTFVTGASATRTWNTTTGTWDNTGTNNNWAEGDLKFYDGDTAIFGDIASDSTITLNGTISPTAVTVQNSANIYTFQTGSIAGTSTLAKSGAGTLVLSAANTFTGATSITDGTVRIGNSFALQNSTVTNNTSGVLTFGTGVTTATLGSLGGSGNISLLNAGSTAVALTAGGNNASTSYAGQLSGTGSFIKNGTGTLSLSGSNGHTGGTTLNAGTLVTSHISALGTGAVTVNGGTLDLDADLTAASLSGTSSTVDAGSHTLTLNAASNTGTFYSGTFTSTGSLVLRGGSHTVQDNLTGGAGSGSGNFLILYNLGPGSSFQLDTGSSATDRRDFGWANDAGVALSLTSLQGHGAVRGDVGTPTGGVRSIIVNQTTDTTFNGAILSHTSGGGAVRSITLTKQGSGSLTLAGFLGEQTASSGTGADVVNLTVEAGTLNVTNSANGTASNGTAGTMTVTGGTLAFSNNALGKGGAGSLVMNGGTLLWNSGNTQDLTALSRLTLVDGKTATFDTNGNDVILAGALGGGAINAAVTKTGSGTLSLGGTNSYTGATSVNNGTLRINGDHSLATGAVTVASGATLAGTGTLGGAVTVSGSVAPGTSGIGTLTVNNDVTWNAGDSWKFDLSDTDATADQLALTGVFTKGSGGTGDFVFDFMGSTPLWNTTYTLVTFDSSSGFTAGIGGNFSYTNLGSGSYSTSFFTLTSDSLTFTAIPEPSTALGGLLLTAGLLRRRRKSEG